MKYDPKAPSPERWLLVNAAHHRALMHGGMLADHIFDHGGEHLEAIVADDEPLDPAVQIDKAVLVQIADVTGVHPDPAIRMGVLDGGGLSRLVVVTLHNAGAGDAQLTPLADGQLCVGARLKDGHQRVDQRQTHAAGLVVPSGSSGGGGGDLGHAVALGDGEFHVVGGQEVVDRLFGTPGDGIAARGIVADEGEILEQR